MQGMLGTWWQAQDRDSPAVKTRLHAVSLISVYPNDILAAAPHFDVLH